MRRLMLIALFVSVLGTLMIRPAAAQRGLGSHDLVASGPVVAVKTDGQLAAWTTSDGKIFVADVITGKVTSLDSTLSSSTATLAVSAGRMAWMGREGDNVAQIRIYNTATGVTTNQPIAKQLESFELYGNLLVWIETEGWPENPRQTGWMRNISTMEPATQLFSRASTLYGGEHLRVNQTYAVWAQAVSIELRGARCYELYKVRLDGSAGPVRLGAGPCSTTINDFALETLVLWYSDSSGTLYRHQLIEAVDAFSDTVFADATDLQASGEYLAGRQYVNAPAGGQERQMWLYDTRSKSKWTVARPVSTNDLPPSIAIGGHSVVWSEKIGSEWQIKIRPISEVTPAAPRAASDPLVQGRTYYAESLHSLGGRFEQYWGKNGGLSVFGFPLTEEFRQQNRDTGVTYDVQYLERQRYEYHPELAGTAYEILLGRLGAEQLEQQGRSWRNEGADKPGVQQLPGNCQTFETTNRTVCGAFLNYWRGHGLDLGQPGTSSDEALALFGLPLTEPRMEPNPDGDTVLTQWFERARFEYHPNNADPYKVLLGRLAAEQLPNFEW